VDYLTNNLAEGGAYRAGAGDVHIYESYPISWEFIESMANLSNSPKPIFVSEGGQSSAIDPIASMRYVLEAGATNRLSDYIEPKIKGLEAIWAKYKLYDVYSNIEEMVIDSQKMAADQRAIYFNVIRSNPKINGYNVTSLTDVGLNDYFGDGEGVMDEFRHFKAGHYQVTSDGWAKLKWCLFVNPLDAYAGQSLRIRVSLANEDVLLEGNYPARLAVSGPEGEAWSKVVTVKVEGGNNPPLAYSIFDEDVKIDGLAEAQYTLSATLLDRPNARADSVRFNITDPGKKPDFKGFALTVLEIDQNLRKLLTSSGVALREYVEKQDFEHEVILVGDEFKGDAVAWRALYRRIAGGGFAIFLSRETLADGKGVNQWIPVDQKGRQTGGHGEANVFHSDIVARDHPVFKGLPHGVLIPEIYGELLRPKARFSDITVPEDAAAVWINQNTGKTEDGLVIGIYNYHKGKFLINSFDLTGNIGQPAADRMILNMVKYGQSNTLHDHETVIDDDPGKAH
jgi:hypothetical protein